MTQYTAEQVLMQDNARRLLGDGLARTRTAAQSWPQVDHALWKEICSAGWPALLLPEGEGGWGSSAGDMVALLEGIADVLAPEPLGPSLVVAPLLARCGTPAAESLMRTFLEGDAPALLAGADPFPLDGEPGYVLSDAQWARTIICPAGSGADFRLLQVSADDLDGQWPLRRTVDGSAQRVFSLAHRAGQELGHGFEVECAYQAACNLLRLGAAASLAGMARRALDMTIDYLKLRKQFGQPIGAFQALQHRAASAHVACVAAHALVCEAARSVGAPNERIACAMAKSKASGAALAVVKECVQMHGAIGFSDEYDLALYFRRVTALASSYGTGAVCRRDVAASLNPPVKNVNGFGVPSCRSP